MGTETKNTAETETTPPRKKQLRGFARNPALAAAAGRKGGMSVPPSERSFSKNPELARKAGRKGGQSVPPAERSFAKNPELAREAGRKGGSSSGSRRAGLAARKAAAAEEALTLTAPPAEVMEEAKEVTQEIVQEEV